MKRLYVLLASFVLALFLAFGVVSSTPVTETADAHNTWYCGHHERYVWHDNHNTYVAFNSHWWNNVHYHRYRYDHVPGAWWGFFNYRCPGHLGNYYGEG